MTVFTSRSMIFWAVEIAALILFISAAALIRGSPIGSFFIFLFALILMIKLCGQSICAIQGELIYKSIFIVKRKYDIDQVKICIDPSYGEFNLEHILISEAKSGLVLKAIPMAAFRESDVRQFIEYVKRI